ncbi:hypothetical protein ACEV76_05245 [Vibrio parahaemolyticus]|uniref:hypothetical protein n=1 Tax=Vibrio parahaemolyticus TaxID=670 RepID=UPI0011216117|nr:hypothetical protein [Vibrio parahaemolyticus]TOF09397.1 hypothetical protein CGJ29_00380 [Vibrio parahaemolyticus]
MNWSIEQIEDQLNRSELKGVINLIANQSDFEVLFEQELCKQGISKQSFNRQFFRAKQQMDIVRLSAYQQALIETDEASEADRLFLVDFFKPLVKKYQCLLTYQDKTEEQRIADFIQRKTQGGQ